VVWQKTGSLNRTFRYGEAQQPVSFYRNWLTIKGSYCPLRRNAKYSLSYYEAGCTESTTHATLIISEYLFYSVAGGKYQLGDDVEAKEEKSKFVKSSVVSRVDEMSIKLVSESAWVAWVAWVAIPEVPAVLACLGDSAA
jgi:hypothetical protein